MSRAGVSLLSARLLNTTKINFTTTGPARLAEIPTNRADIFHEINNRRENNTFNDVIDFGLNHCECKT